MTRTRAFVAALVVATLASSFAQFGAVSALNDVARHFGHAVGGRTLRRDLALSGSTLGLGL
ncbi:MAG: hypothetical protein ACRDV0_06285, partial [Acidimicrobiales bacterium]